MRYGAEKQPHKTQKGPTQRDRTLAVEVKSLLDYFFLS